MSQDISKALVDLDSAIAKANDAAKAAGHGLVVALLHWQAQSATVRMIEK